MFLVEKYAGRQNLRFSEPKSQPWPEHALQLPPRLQSKPHVVSAYNICLKLEKFLQEAADGGQDVWRNIVYIRILGYLIHHVPTDRELRTILQEIVSCKDDTALLGVGRMYYDSIRCAFANLLFIQCANHVTQLEPLRAQRQYPPIMHLFLRLIRYQIWSTILWWKRLSPMLLPKEWESSSLSTHNCTLVLARPLSAMGIVASWLGNMMWARVAQSENCKIWFARTQV